MQRNTLSVLGAAAAGACVATLLFASGSPRPASAQINQPIPIGGSVYNPNTTPTVSNPQPIEVTALGPEQFVVATREPRLVQLVSNGTTQAVAQNMLVTVVTHYTLRGDRLLPVEHVRVPTGYRLITIEE